MTWLTLAFLGMFIWSCTAVVDRFALYGRVTSKRFYVVVPALLQLPLVLLFPIFFTPTSLEPITILVSIVGGLIEVALLYYLFVAMSAEEVGRVFPLTSVSAVLTLLAGVLFLNDTLSSSELLAFSLIVVGGVVLSIKISESGTSLSFIKSLRPLLIGAALSSAYTLALRFAFTETDFATGFFFSRIGFFLGGMIVLVIWRKEIAEQWRVLSRNMRVLIIGNQAVAFSGHAFYFSALALANAALVQSVLAIQGVVIFIIASVVSFINPKLIAESITLRDLAQKGVGILLIVVALSLLV